MKEQFAAKERKIMDRREVSELIFNYIKKEKFKPINIQYGNGYFIFDKGENGVVHFNIKGLHGWKFGMWINTNEEELKNENGEDYSCIQFFCQHKDNIDKFKPSRSYFCAAYGYDEINSFSKNKEPQFLFYKIISILKMIKKHPFASFNHDAVESEYLTDGNIAYYLSTKLYNIKENIKELWFDFSVKIWHGSKVWFVSKYKVVNRIEFVDKNSCEWKVSPRYDTRINFNKISDNEDTQQVAEINVLDRWYHKNYYHNMNLHLTREGVDECYGYQMCE